MIRAIPEKVIDETNAKFENDPEFMRQVERRTDYYLEMVLAHSRQIARELALLGVCSIQIAAEVDWGGAVVHQKLQTIDPKRIAFLNDLQNDTRISTNPKS